jgi:1-acyl-sn-glycerol-3-phosphate acyltransferase
MDGWYRLVNGLGRVALRALAVDVRWTGVEHLPRTGPVVLAANHVSFADFALLERAAVTRGRYVRFLCRHDVWDKRAVGFAMDRMGHVPVDRHTAAYAYLRARTLLRAGEAVGVFPEAGVSWSWTVRPLMRGAVALARDTGAPLVPVALWGGQRIFSVREHGRRLDLTRGRRVDVAFGAPEYVEPAADLVEGTTRLGHTLTRLLEDLQRQPHHRPAPGEHAEWYPAHLGGDAMDRRRARSFDVVPRSAVTPTWGPDPAGAFS